jgi:hypothetical protein
MSDKIEFNRELKVFDLFEIESDILLDTELIFFKTLVNNTPDFTKHSQTSICKVWKNLVLIIFVYVYTVYAKF